MQQNPITIIITAYKEPDSIIDALDRLCNFGGYDGEIEIIQISPDDPTLEAGKSFTKSLENKNIKFVQIKDPNIGKPHALNLGLSKATHDIIVLSDGDVMFEKNALKILVEKFIDLKVAGACGRVLSVDSRENFMGYISHLMTAAAHHKRMIELAHVHDGLGTKFVNKTNFFPLNGYIAILDKKIIEEKIGKPLQVPEDCLVDDAYISYVIFNAGLKLGYIPQAEVLVKFPTHLKDYILQKKRSTGGFIQLWKYGVVKKETKSRSFWHELRYFWFPIVFAKNLRELIWSIAFYPLRLYLWLMIWWERKILHKSFDTTWVRIESTK